MPHGRERELVRPGERLGGEPPELGHVVCGDRLAVGQAYRPVEIQRRGRVGRVAVDVHPRTDEPLGLADKPRLLVELPAKSVDGMLAFLEEPAGWIPETEEGLDGPAREEQPARRVLDQRADARRGVRVVRRAARPPTHSSDAVVREVPFAPRTGPPTVEDRHLPATVSAVSPRHVPASVTELSRVGLLQCLPGETLMRLAERMAREELPGGHTIMAEGDGGDRFYVLLSGLAAVTQRGRGARGMLRPGEAFGEVALAMDVPRTATVTTMVPSVVASCDRATFDELLRPLFADDV
jgi:Cyclic nucleotide-binding domain